MELQLGTAQFGWNVGRKEAFALLDAWLALGLNRVDCATNYPINKQAADFRAAENILAEYCRAHGLSSLKITMKVGSVDNMRSPEALLTPSFLYMSAEHYRRLLGDNFHTMMIHWDPRDDLDAISESLEALSAITRDDTLQPGLSGIAHPALYAQANEKFNMDFDVQVKHHLFHSDLPRYAPLLSRSRCWAYGLNAGGLRLDGAYDDHSTLRARGLDPERFEAHLGRLRSRMEQWTLAFVRPPVRNMNQIGMLYGALHPDLHGLLIGPRTPAQLRQSVAWLRDLSMFDYSDVYADLTKMSHAFSQT